MPRAPSTLLEAGARAAAAGERFPVRAGLRCVPPATPTGWLVDGAGGVHPLAPLTRVGRDELAADLVILHDSVSRRHAQLGWDAAAGRWLLTDLTSTNGTFVDGRRVGAGPVALRDGALLVLGAAPLVFLEDQAPGAEIAPTAPPLLRLASLVGAQHGHAELGGRRVALEGRPWLLAHALAARWQAEPHLGAEARGYVRSGELVHLMQPTRSESLAAVVRLAARRLERDLATIGAAERLEASERLGYRLLAAQVA